MSRHSFQSLKNVHGLNLLYGLKDIQVVSVANQLNRHCKRSSGVNLSPGHQKLLNKGSARE